jgi:hypothetical protein
LQYSKAFSIAHNKGLLSQGKCLAPSICSLDVCFFDKGTTANNFAQIQNQYLLPMSLRICLSELAMQDSRNRFIDAD